MKEYVKPEAEYIDFTTEDITDNLPSTGGGAGSNVVGEEGFE